MITPKQWKKFNEYRDALYKEITESKEYKDIKFPEFPKDEIREVNGFWGVRKVIYSPTYYSHVAFELAFSFALSKRHLLLSKVPAKTVEACLDWLANKKQI